MKNASTIVLLLFGLLGYAGANESLPLSLYGEKLLVRENLSVQAGRLLYPRNNEQPLDEAADLYVVAWMGHVPMIIDRIYGHTPQFEIRDINSDGKNELLLWYHTGANQFGLKIYTINEKVFDFEYFTPVKADLMSNMGSIKIVDGQIILQNQQFVSSPQSGAILSTETYRFVGQTAERIGTRLEFITK